MTLFGWPTCPVPILDQVSGVLESIRALLGQALLGVYLHGSLAYGCFNPHCSDSDLLVLTERPLLPATKLGLVKSLLRRSTAPAPLELSLLARSDLVPWQYPTPYQLHDSEAWRERLSADTSSLAWLQWPAGQQGTDPDLAAHVSLARARGFALAGPAPAAVFPEVPAADYLASIVADSEAALATPLANPVATVLNLCRVSWYLRASVLSSKEEAGVWAQESIQPAHRELVNQALAVYRGTTAAAVWDGEAVRRFGQQVLALTAAASPQPASAPAQQLPLGSDG